MTETTDKLQAYDLKIIQPRHGYRFSLDPLLLCDFANLHGVETIADLGTGCGVMPLVFARKSLDLKIVGIETQEEMAELATRNVLLNGLSERVSVLHRDVNSLRRHLVPSSFDLVVANPPYRKPGTGRISPKPGRDLARHESTASLADFLSAAKYLVKPSGKICFIYHPSRIIEFLMETAALKLAPLRLRMVHGDARAEARMFLVELVKGRKGDLAVMPPLLVYEMEGEYTDEVKEILGFDVG